MGCEAARFGGMMGAAVVEVAEIILGFKRT